MDSNASVSLIRYLKQRWLLCPNCQPPLIGCSEAQLDALRVAQNVARLPELYCEFMRQMGVANGGLDKLSQVAMTYEDVLNFKSPQEGYCLPILRLLGLEKSSFVFCLEDQGFFFYIFDTNDQSDDPMVYCIYDSGVVGENFVKKTAGLLSATLVDFVEEFCSDLSE